jgi:hypothetical protein
MKIPKIVHNPKGDCSRIMPPNNLQEKTTQCTNITCHKIITVTNNQYQ